MYCQRCGNKVSEGDILCSKCGAKLNDKFDNERRLALFMQKKLRQIAIDETQWEYIRGQIFKFFICAVVFSLVTILIFIIFPDGRYTFGAFAFRCLFLTTLLFLFFLPLVFGLFLLKKKFYATEIFFLLLFLMEVEFFTSRQSFLPFTITFFGFLIGVILLIACAVKKFSKR